MTLIRVSVIVSHESADAACEALESLDAAELGDEGVTGPAAVMAGEPLGDELDVGVGFGRCGEGVVGEEDEGKADEDTGDDDAGGLPSRQSRVPSVTAKTPE